MSTTNTENQPKIEENHAQKETESATELKAGVQPKKNGTNENQIIENKDIKLKKKSLIDSSIIALNSTEQENEIIKELNNPKTSEEKVPEKKQSFMQKTKSWLGKAWTDFKNSKYNIFKGEEMEECLDAHGFPIKIPKRKHNQNPDKKEEDKK